MCFSLSFSNSFSREARNNLVQSMKFNALDRALVEASPNKFPSFTAVHQCSQMSVSVST